MRQGAEITSLRFDASLWPVEHQMQFETDDDYVNNLFKMSSATLHTSMHRFYLDGVKRDFLPWSMDALVSTLAGIIFSVTSRCQKRNFHSTDAA